MGTYDLIQFVLVGGIVFGNGVNLAFKLMNKKKNGNGSFKYIERLAIAETEIGILKEDHKVTREENKEDHGKIFTSLEGIKVIIARKIKP